MGFHDRVLKVLRSAEALEERDYTFDTVTLGASGNSGAITIYPSAVPAAVTYINTQTQAAVGQATSTIWPDPGTTSDAFVCLTGRNVENAIATETNADPKRQLYLTRIYTGTVAMTGGLTGVEVRSTFNGTAASTSGEVKGAEFKARHTNANAYDVGTFKGVIGNCDSKTGAKTITSAWAVEGQIDCGVSSTITTAAGCRVAYNEDGTVTNAYGIFVDGTSVWDVGVKITASKATTAIQMGACTTGILMDGAMTTGINITGVASTAAIAITSATGGKMTMTVSAETASDPGRHIYLQRTYTGTLGAGKGLTGVEVRSTFNGAAAAATSEVKGGEFKARHTNANAYDVGTMKGVIGNVDSKTGAKTITSAWALEGQIDCGVSSTITTGAGCRVAYNEDGTVTNAYGLYVDGTSVWDVGLQMTAGKTAKGIYLSSTTYAAEMIVTALPANARGARYAFTCATPAMSDGYGAVELDLTISGVGTGQITASSAWVNLSATATAPGYCHVHNDGIWQDASATISAAYIAISKFQMLLSDNPAWCSIWEMNWSGANSEIDSMFNCNNPDLALGYQAGTPTKAAVGSIPFCSTAGGVIRYIYLYDAADAD